MSNKVESLGSSKNHEVSQNQPSNFDSSIVPWNQRRYRDRHGRGIRQPLYGLRLPRFRTHSGIFDNLVAAQLRRLQRAWPELLQGVQCAVEDVPPSSPLVWEEATVALSQSFPARHSIPARIVLYRLPIESRSHSRLDLELYVRDEIVRQLSELSGYNPEDIDPSYNR